MRGNILDYSIDDDVGVISGPDGIRYKFSLADWKHKCPVISGVNVDYVVVSGIATEIYCTDKEALDNYAEKISAEKFSEIERLEAITKKIEQETKLSKINSITQDYQGNYVSSDMALWKGVIAGACHKAGGTPYAGRIIAVGILLSPIFLLMKEWALPAIFMVIINLLFICSYFNTAKKFRAVPTGDAKAIEYTNYIRLKNKTKSPNKLNKIASFIHIMAGKRPDGTRGAVAYDPAVRAIYSNTVTCKECHSTLTLSNNYMDHNCNVCKSSISLSYYPEGSIKDIRQ